MKYAVLDYQEVNGFFNIGDYVQSLAAAQYLPVVDKYVNRERLSEYDDEKVKMILNGWFMHEPENWPPSDKIDPLFVSFHINRPHLEKMLSPSSIDYFKKHGPVGCRDYHTAEKLRARGVDAYYSGCLTTTLGKGVEPVQNREGILFVDVMHAIPDFSEYKAMPFRYLGSHLRAGNIALSARKKKWLSDITGLVPQDLKSEVEFVKNSIDGSFVDTDGRFKMARQYLDKLARAKLVFTSRIHCALPCLALNTPVVFVKAGQKSKSNILRFKGVIDHMNVVDYDGDMRKYGFKSNILSLSEIDVRRPPLNPESFKELAIALASECERFVEAKDELSES